MASERFEPALRNAIAKHRAETREQRERIYEAARASFQRSARSSEDIEALNEAITTIEASFADNSVAAERTRKWKNLTTAALTLLLGLGIGAFATSYFTSSPMSASEQEIGAKFVQQYNEGLRYMPAAVDYLREVTDAIVERQRNDRDSLAPANGKFVSLASIDKNIAGKISKEFPPRTDVIVRADQKDLKILFNWTLCGVARISNPEMLDPVRSKMDSFGCPYFGVWTPGAANW